MLVKKLTEIGAFDLETFCEYKLKLIFPKGTKRGIVKLMSSTNDHYLAIINKYNYGIFHQQSVDTAKATIDPLIKAWAGNYLESSNISGSLAKGTAITLGSDFDLFISLTSNLTTMTLKDIYNNLDKFLTEKYYFPRRQNVSLGITVNGLKVDLTPGRQQEGYVNYHSIFLSKKDSWTQTNIKLHIDTVKNSGRINEIKLTKIWSRLHNLDFPSFYLELVVLEALKGQSKDALGVNFLIVLSYLAKDFQGATFLDPANTNNLISDSLTSTEKTMIAKRAKEDHDAPTWGTVIW